VTKGCIGLAALVLALAGCGGGTLGADDAAKLHAAVAAVRTAADKGDQAGALKALAALQARVNATDGLPAADERTLKTGIARLRRRLGAGAATPAPATPGPASTPTQTPTPAATPSPTPSPTAAPPKAKGPPPGKGKDENKGKGRGKEKG
jgi:hypothetical protein